MTTPVYLIDGSSYLFRAHHAMPGLTTSKGFPTGALLGVTRMLLKLLDDEAVESVAVVFDEKGKTIRNEWYPEYKANRPPAPPEIHAQFEPLLAILRGLGLPVITAGNLEADDLIAALTVRAQAEGRPVVIVSGDKDLFQLVEDGVTVVDTMRNRTYDAMGVQEKLGVRPDQVVDFLAIKGDSVDNVPGVKGIGDKGAKTLLAQFDHLEDIYEGLHHVPSASHRKKLEASRDMALLSKKLVTLIRDAEIPYTIDELVRGEPDAPKLIALFKEYELRSLIELVVPRPTQATKASRVAYHAITDEGHLKNVCRKIRERGRLSVDLETTSLDTRTAHIVGIALAIEPGSAWYVPVRHEGVSPQLDLATALKHLRPLFVDATIAKIGQNLKYDQEVLLQEVGISLEGIEMDTMLASYLLDSSRSRHNLDELAREHLGYTMTSYKEVTTTEGISMPFANVPLDKATFYACEDADIALGLAEVFGPRIEERGLGELLRELEIPVSMVLARMELAGIKVDGALLTEQSVELGRSIARLVQEIHALAGRSFDINSPKQLGQILFDEIGLTPIKKTKTGYSTNQSVLEQLTHLHDLPSKILEYRHLTKLKSTYMDTFPKEINAATGRVHSSFHQTVAATGRLSSSEPNLQNIPIRTEVGRRIREAFVPEDGAVFLSADYSQVELRVLAHLTGDRALTAAFEEGEDIHRKTASMVFGKDPEEITATERRYAKTINFGILYGMSAFRLSNELGIPRKEAADMIDRYFGSFPAIKGWMDDTLDKARSELQVSTILGRVRPIPDINASNRNVRAGAERIAINTPVQGSAADLIKLAMIRVQDALDAKRLSSRILLQVHDELLLEVPEAELETVTALVRREMEGVYDLSVPLTVDIGVGPNWAEAH